MARSPLTLAASVTSALPRVGVVGVGALTEGTTGRYDTAVVQLDDGRRVVVRVPAESDAAADLAAEVRALRALTPGVRGLLPFRAPELLGETGIDDVRAVVVDFLPGYRVDAAHLPPGRGASTSLGAALAALHGLPLSIVRTEGLPVRTPQQIRDDVSRLIDRADATRALPRVLRDRWLRAVASPELWRFESAVVLGGAGAASFLFEDIAGVPEVTGLLDWHGLSVGDPATDLQWLASAPTAADDVYAAYVVASGRAPDEHARDRARLYAELEFAKWLIHGHETGRRDVVDDATVLLGSLAEGVGGGDIVTDSPLDVDDAIALLERLPESPEPAADTSMHTDAYDAEELSLWLPDEPERPASEPATTAEASARVEADVWRDDDVSTAPIELPLAAREEAGDDASTDAAADAERASDAALRRWMSQ